MSSEGSAGGRAIGVGDIVSTVWISAIDPVIGTGGRVRKR
jgi:hypothetical protein